MLNDSDALRHLPAIAMDWQYIMSEVTRFVFGKVLGHRVTVTSPTHLR